MKKNRIVTCIASVLLLLSGCTKSHTIIGKWSWNDGSSSEYLSDGTFASSEGWSGKWSIKDDILTINAPLGINAAFEIQEMSGSSIKLRQLANNKELVGTRKD